MRLVFECTACGSHYLPPEAMSYGPDDAASPLWCSRCQAEMREAGVPEPEFAARVALAAARAQLAARVQGAEEPARPDARPSRPPVSRRARSAPAASRGRLG